MIIKKQRSGKFERMLLIILTFMRRGEEYSNHMASRVPALSLKQVSAEQHADDPRTKFWIKSSCKGERY